MNTHEYAYVSGESLTERMDRAYNEMVARDVAAKAEGVIIGRYLTERAADGYAYYEIIGVDGKNNTLQLEHLDIYDGWTVPMYEGLIDCFPLHYATQNLEARDTSHSTFGK